MRPAAFLALLLTPLLASSAADPDWNADFQKRYALADGQVLKRVGAPYPECRDKLFDDKVSRLGVAKRAADAVMTYRYDGKTVMQWGVTGRGANPIGITVGDIIEWTIGFPLEEVEGDRNILKEFVEGEFVYRSDTPPEKWAPELQRILRDECKLPLKFEFKEVTREVVVVSGTYDSKPWAGKDKNTVVVCATEGAPYDGAGGGTGSLAEFVQFVGRFVSKRMVIETEKNLPSKITWINHGKTSRIIDPMRGDITTPVEHNMENVLKVVAGQTGLKFKVEDRKVRVLVVSRDEGKK